MTGALNSSAQKVFVGVCERSDVSIGRVFFFGLGVVVRGKPLLQPEWFR